MDIFKKWLPTGLLALAGILALSLGFSSAFGGSFVPGMSMKMMYDGFSSHSIVPSIFVSHAGMAYIGGIITGVLGLISLVVAAFLGYRAYNDELLNNMVIIISIISFVILLSLAIAVVVCKTDLNSISWWINNMQGLIKGIMKQQGSHGTMSGVASTFFH